MRIFLLFISIVFFQKISTAQLSATINITDQRCYYGQCDGSATITATGGVPPYTYAFNGDAPSTNPTIDSLCRTTMQGGPPVTFTVTDQNLSTFTGSFTVGFTSDVQVSVSSLNVHCYGSCEGSVSIDNVGYYVPPYTWQVLDSVGNIMNPNQLCMGNYGLQVTDAIGCTGDAAFQIVSTTMPVPSVTVTGVTYDVSSLGGYDGAIDVTLTGSNSGPFFYVWNFNSEAMTGFSYAEDVHNLTDIGEYRFRLYDDQWNNCSQVMYHIKVADSTQSSITGYVFLDFDSNCGYDIFSEEPAHGVSVNLNPGNRVGYADSTGRFMISSIPFGTYTLSLGNSNPYLNQTCPSSTLITISSSTVVSHDIATVLIATSAPDVKVDVVSTGSMTPGFSGSVSASLQNLNDQAAYGFIKLILPSSFIPAITNVTPSSYTLSGDTVIWSINGSVFSLGIDKFNIDFVTPVSTPLASTFSCCVIAQVSNDLNFSNNTSCYQQLVTGSFDPNDKAVSPVGVGANHDIHANEDELTYLIRFQNTGNGPAVNIVIKDTLSPFVDISTLEMVGSSHSQALDVLDGNILRWRFNNIMLPDSNSNEPASHGYVSYKVKHTVGSIPGTRIENTAFIYFDFNAPVVTNTAFNTIETVTSVMSNKTEVGNWLLYPNPTSSLLYIVNRDLSLSNSNIKILNHMGQIVYESALLNNESIDMQDFANGVYCVQITSNNHNYSSKIILNK